jgi:hypothetical protein
MTEVNELLSEREKTHGRFADVSYIAQELKDTLRRSPNWKNIKSRQREALDMICNKMGRLLSGNPNFEDHSDDIVGYAVLLRRALDD